jgi:flagellin-like hook-associated protein FlgL
MSAILANIGVAFAQGGLRVPARQPISRAITNATAFGIKSTAEADSDAMMSAVSRHDLLAMNAGVDHLTRTTNSLSTANDAIGVIGGMLVNIQTVLSATAPNSKQTVDPVTEQSRIDNAIITIDAIASVSQFGGRHLLDGSFSLTGSANSLSLPSFVSSTLGSTSTADTNGQTPSLESLKSGGTNDLASGNHAAANEVVTTALSQIASTQIQITGYLSGTGGLDMTTVQLPNAAIPGDATTADAMYTTAAQMLNEPSLASLAAANSLAHSVLMLLQP